jgi:hypothetical protein
MIIRSSANVGATSVLNVRAVNETPKLDVKDIYFNVKSAYQSTVEVLHPGTLSRCRVARLIKPLSLLSSRPPTDLTGFPPYMMAKEAQVSM